MSIRSTSSASKIGNERKSEIDFKRTVPGNIKHWHDDFIIQNSVYYPSLADREQIRWVYKRRKYYSEGKCIYTVTKSFCKI